MLRQQKRSINRPGEVEAISNKNIEQCQQKLIKHGQIWSKETLEKPLFSGCLGAA